LKHWHSLGANNEVLRWTINSLYLFIGDELSFLLDLDCGDLCSSTLNSSNRLGVEVKDGLNTSSFFYLLIYVLRVKPWRFPRLQSIQYLRCAVIDPNDNSQLKIWDQNNYQLFFWCDNGDLVLINRHSSINWFHFKFLDKELLVPYFPFHHNNNNNNTFWTYLYMQNSYPILFIIFQLRVIEFYFNMHIGFVKILNTFRL